MKEHTRGLIIVLVSIMAILLTPGRTYGRISLKERDALEALYNKTNGSQWRHQDNWKKAPGTETSWTGITLDAGNTIVIKIELKK
ncbi:MAG: hypothetical protein MUF15_08400 [Acidobacteria bacterium]|jgi:hypothetical protein|nr:hypothetical protein [Acidobacteriota bacterium]